MKVQILLSTMVLAAAFTGCSNDEWSDNSLNTSGLDRRVAGKVTISLPTDTRMEQNGAGQIVWSADDRISAALMDEFKGVYPVQNPVNYMQTNYPFSLENGKWTSEGVLLEGNYFFSYPFNACLQNRGALTNTVPVNQLAYDEETGEVSTMQSYVDNQFYLGYSYISADGTCADCDEIPALEANMKLEKIHAYPVFRFINQTGSPSDKPLKVYKISLRKKDKSLFYNTVAVFPKTKKFAMPAEADENNSYGLWETAVFNPNMPNSIVTEAAVLPFESSVVNSRTLEYNLIYPEGGYEVPNWTNFEACMVVPAGVYGEMEVVLYTNEGVGTYGVFMPEDGEDYQIQSGMYKLTPTKKSVTTIRFDINSLKTNQTDFIVQSTENLLEYLKYYHLDPDGVSGNSVKLNITTVGEKVELSQEVYDELKNLNLKINLTGVITIPANVPADAIDRINFFGKGSKVINKGEQVVEEIPASDRFILDSNVMFENEGTLTLKTDVPNSTVVNKGQLIVEDAKVFTLINTADGTVEVNDELTAINLLNLGKMTIGEGAKVNSLEAFSNAGELVNDGTLATWPMKIVGEKIYRDYEDQYENYTITTLWPVCGRHHRHNLDCFKETITINIPKLIETFILSDASVANVGIIENNGIINCYGEVTSLENWEYIEILDKDLQLGDFTFARVTSMLNIGAGTINNNAGGRITNLSNFAYLDPAPTSYTYLVTVDLEQENIPQIEWVKDYIQDGHVGGGLIDMTANDGKDINEQAVIRDNVTMKEIDEVNHGQIIFVYREGEKATVGNLPKYVNTIWLNDAKVTLEADVKEYTVVFSGNSLIKIEDSKTLTLGETIFAGDTRFWGAGTTKLTTDVHVNAGVALTLDNVWDATGSVSIFARGAKINVGGKFNREKIAIDYENLSDYVGPWIVVD